jgi:NADH-quinone oxidoreductase subunit G
MDKVNIFINNKEYKVDPSKNLLANALENDIQIPYFCYHPALQVAGNCRLCLVELEGVPKLQPSCNTDVKEGLKVFTESEKVIKTRALMLELFTKNHPLDCPICDKSGECMLQDMVYDFGEKRDRYKEKKRVYPYQHIGDKIERNMDRCVMCSRCERFVRDIVKSEEYGFYGRGEKTNVSISGSTPLTNNHQGNLHDICPVGALTTKDFRFKKRVWYLNTTDSVCPLCATGCNAEIHHHKNEIFRLTPKMNLKVNGYFMCDFGRFSYHKFEYEQRLLTPKFGNQDIGWDDAITKFSKLLGASKKYGIVGGANLTNEDLSVVKKFIDSAKPTNFIDYRISSEQKSDKYPKEDFLINKHKYPNSKGARHFGLYNNKTEFNDILKKVRSKELDLLIVLEENLQDSGILNAIPENYNLVLLTSFKNNINDKIKLALPITCFSEADGSYTNFSGYVQMKKQAIVPDKNIRHPFWIFQKTAKKLNKNIGDFETCMSITEKIQLPERIEE